MTFTKDFLNENTKALLLTMTDKNEKMKLNKSLPIRIVDRLQKCGLFSDFQYGFRSSRSTADLVKDVSDRITRAFNRSGATRAVTLEIYPRLSIEFGMLVFFTNLSLTKFQVRYLPLFLLFSLIDSFGWFWMGGLYKNIQLMLEFLKGSSSCCTLLNLLIIFSILRSMVMILLPSLNVKRHLTCCNN